MDLRNLIFNVCVCVFILSFSSGCQEQMAAVPEVESEREAVAVSEAAVAVTEKAVETKAESKEAPEIKFADIMHDFGEIGPGTNHLCEFKFQNAGAGPLKIKKVSKTCGCTPFTLEKDEYSPGESGVLKVKYHADARAGATTKYLFMYTNDPKNEKISLMIKAKIVEKVEYEPKVLNLVLKDDNIECPDIKLRSLDTQPFAITKFMATGGCISVDYNPTRKANRYVLKPDVDVNKVKRDGRGVINISLSHPECGLVTIPFSLLARFAVEPRSLIAMNVKPQEPIKREFFVMNNYKEAFEVESVSSQKGDIVKLLKAEKIDDYRYKFEVEMIPPAAENNRKIFSEVLYVNIKGGERLRVPCRGFYAR